MSSSKTKLETRLREISESLLCRGGTGHYCPNCDNTTFDAAMSLKMLADQIGAPDETTTPRRGYKVVTGGEPCICGDHPGGVCDKPCCSIQRDLMPPEEPRETYEQPPYPQIITDRLRQIANVIDSRPVLGHWPAMMAQPDADFLRSLSSSLVERRPLVHPLLASSPLEPSLPHLDTCSLKYAGKTCTCGAEKATRPLPDHLKAPVKAGDPCPAIDDVHTEHQGKCVYCGAPMAQAEATALYTCGSDYCPHQPKCAQVNGSEEQT